MARLLLCCAIAMLAAQLRAARAQVTNVTATAPTLIFGSITIAWVPSATAGVTATIVTVAPLNQTFTFDSSPLVAKSPWIWVRH
jgi:hypothetical protein